jgi:ABC-type glycerol-3-phosphate transport system substrate-binding protein
MGGLFQNKRFLIIAGIVVTLILGIIAILVFGQPQQTAVVVDKTKVTLNWLVKKGEERNYKEIIKSFTDIPGNDTVDINIVEVDYEESGNFYYRKLITDIAKGKGPDLFFLRGDELPAWKDYLTPVTNVFNLTDSKILADYKDNFVDLVFKETVDRDKIYGVTTSIDTLQLYYNKTILEQAQIPLPPESWNDLDRQINLLNKRNVNNSFDQSAISLGTGLSFENGNLNRDSNIVNFQDIMSTLVMQNGNNIYDRSSGRSVLSASSTGNQNNPLLNALKFYTDFAEPNSTRYSWSVDSRDNVELFLEGKLAYLINYSDFQQVIEERNSRLNYEISALPQLNQNNKKTIGKYFMNVINRQLEVKVEENSRNSESVKKLQKAREFLYFLSTEASQEQYISATSKASSHRKIIDRQLQGEQKIRTFAAGNLYADNYYKPDIERAEKMWGNLIYRTKFENETLESSISKMVSEYNLTVSGDPKIRI